MSPVTLRIPGFVPPAAGAPREPVVPVAAEPPAWPPTGFQSLSGPQRFGWTSIPPGLAKELATNAVPNAPGLRVPGLSQWQLPRSVQEAPAVMDVLAPLQPSFRAAWARTGNTGNETGFLLATSAEQNVLLVNQSGGESHSVQLDFRLEDGQQLAGVFHTHPGDDDVFTSFSGHDTTAFIGGRHAFELVQTGSNEHPRLGQQYLYLRTGETRRPPVSPEEFRSSWRASVDTLINDFGLSFPDAIHLTNARTAQEYGFAYYEGHGGRLRKVDFDDLAARLLPAPAAAGAR